MKHLKTRDELINLNEDVYVDKFENDDEYWDTFAKDLMFRFCIENDPNYVVSGGEYDNPYDYILLNIQISDLIEFIREKQ